MKFFCHALFLSALVLSLPLGAVGPLGCKVSHKGFIPERLIDMPVTLVDRVIKTNQGIVAVELFKKKPLSPSSLRRLSPVSPDDSVDAADVFVDVASEDSE